MEQQELNRPVPAPRRLYPELRKSEYENVQIDFINKSLNINAENIHNRTNCTEKLPNNKVFLATDEFTAKCVLTETNDLYGPNANENVVDDNANEAPSSTRTMTTSENTTTPRAAPRPRKPNDNNNASDVYENVEIRVSATPPEIIKPSTGAISKTQNVSPSTVRIQRKAPELPPKTYATYCERNQRRLQRYSIGSDISTTSSYNVNHGDSLDSSCDDKLKKSSSNTTLNSSVADSTESTESSKFKSPSPGYVELSGDESVGDPIEATDRQADEHNHDAACANDLLKSLGSTSKLLTESIGERVAIKAKGAKHKLDKNLKSSTELLGSIGTETSARLMKASRRFGSNFTFGKREPKDRSAPDSMEDRPQTLPPNDKVFKISFSSPLSKKADGCDDLTMQDSDCSYEVPRNVKVAASDDNLSVQNPPSYEDALRASPTPPMQSAFSRNVQQNRSLMVPKHMAMEAANIAKQRSNNALNRVVEEAGKSNSDSGSRNSMDLPSPPMPSFPPPSLPPPSENDSPLYGKINAVKPPARLKRRKNYEQIELRRAADSPTDAASLRPCVDSTELHRLNVDVIAAQREESMLLRQHIASQEKQVPQPDRSDSWEFCEDFDEDERVSECSSPEPVYANQEATYGKVFEMANSNVDLLPPSCATAAKQPARPEDELGAVGGGNLRDNWTTTPAMDVIQEFDPLASSPGSTICRTDKSNQLLLLEHMLAEETYGTIKSVQNKSYDDISVCTSEEDNLNVSVKDGTPPPLTVVLPTLSEKRSSLNGPSSPKPMQIVHQNAQLLSESMENMLDDDVEPEVRAQPYLCRVDEQRPRRVEVDLAPSSHNRTNWFVSDDKENVSQTRVNPFNKMNIELEESPPSYLEAIQGDAKPTNSNSPPTNDQKSMAARFMNTMNVFSNVKIRVDALKRKTSFKAAQKAQSDVKVPLQMIPRPSISPLLVRYEGPLVRFPAGVVEDILKEMQTRKAIIRDRQFQTFLDSDMKTPKEIIPLEYITTLQCVSNSRVTDNATHFYCFEITTAGPKSLSGGSNASSNGSNVMNMSNPNTVMTSGVSANCKPQRISHLYGVGKESERDVWMQKILESLTNTLPLKYICHYYRAGWCYLKNSITSEWSGTWLVLKKRQRRLAFVTEESGNVEKMDLRKARCIVLKESDESICNLHVENGPTLMIDCPPFTVYMIMSSSRETKIWRHIIREVAHNNGFALGDQQLTKFNVPVIVDKCINFVYIHGSMSEGIYRKSGSENSILKLMTAFRTDAFNVEITRNEYNEHDVANVLKRFMRDLPERLMGKLSESFISVSALETVTDKIQAYKELLARLTTIERETLKKIVGHLAFISSQRSKNKMSVQNLTMIWGPTLLKCHQSEEMVYSQKEADVLTDLIVLHKNLFPLSGEEMKKETEMLMCLQKYYAAAETLSDSVKKSGDLKVWITLNPNPEDTTDEKTQVNVTLTPTKTAYDICRELALKMRVPTNQVTLHEVILNDTLERPLHHDTKVFDIVLNWSYWPEEDRKNNYLVVKPVDILREVQRAIKNLATITPGKELKFADNRTKSFKLYLCELRDGKIVVSKKDKNDKSTIVREVFLHSCTMYLGCEKKRDFPWSWALTFVERNQRQIMRSRDAPYIGHVLAGSEWMDRTIWFASIWYCLYGENILPPAEIIIK